MTVYATQSISNDKVKVRWEEPYVSAALNIVASALPAGVYRGFEPRQAAVPNATVVLDLPRYASGGAGPSLAVCRAGSFADVDTKPVYSVAIVEDAAVAVSVGTALPNNSGVTRTIYVIGVPVYVQGVATTAQYRVVDTAELATLITTTGLVVFCRIDIPNLATTILTSYVAKSENTTDGLKNSYAKSRPWDFLSGGSVSGDSPDFGFVNPGWVYEWDKLRDRGLQQIYDIDRGNAGGVGGAVPGDSTFSNTTKGKGRRLNREGNGPLQILAGHDGFQPGDAFTDLVQQGCIQIVMSGSLTSGTGQDYVGTALSGDEWGVVVDENRDANNRQRFAYLVRSHFGAAEPGRSAVTSLASQNAVLFNSTNEIRPDTATQPGLKFGHPTGGAGSTKVSDIAPGDIVEIVSSNNGNGLGLYVVSGLADDGVANAKLLVYHVGTGAAPNFSGLSMTSGYIRVFRNEFWAGKGGDLQGFSGITVDEVGMNVRCAPSSTARGLRITVGEDGIPFEIHGPPANTSAYWDTQVIYDALNGWTQNRGPHYLKDSAAAYYKTDVGHASGGYRYGTVTGTNNTRWARIHQTSCIYEVASGTLTSVSRTSPAPPRMDLQANANCSVWIQAAVRLPRGAVIQQVWAWLSTTGTMVGRDTFEFVKVNNNTVTTIATAAITHTNGVNTLVTTGSFSSTATQVSADPAGAWDDYLVRYLWEYDTTAAGNQSFRLYSFLVKYNMPTGSELREGT